MVELGKRLFSRRTCIFDHNNVYRVLSLSLSSWVKVALARSHLPWKRRGFFLLRRVRIVLEFISKPLLSLVKSFATCWLRLSRGLSYQQRVTDTVACLFDALLYLFGVFCAVFSRFNFLSMWRTIFVACFGLNVAVNVPGWLRLWCACALHCCVVYCVKFGHLYFFCASFFLHTAVHRITQGLPALRTGR